MARLRLDEVEPSDPGLRTDVVAALRVRAGRGAAGHEAPMVWLTRTGGLELQDVDAAGWPRRARRTTRPGRR